jgi:hypothetical protein
MQRLPLLPPRKYLLFFVPLHAGLSWALFLSAFSIGMHQFDTGAPDSLLQTVVETSSNVLLSPVFTAVVESKRLRPLFPGLLGYFPLLLNSAVWAFLVWAAVVMVSRLSAFSRSRPAA